MSKPLFLCALLLVIFAHVAEATPIIVVGQHNLLPDLPEQEIKITVSGGDQVQGLNFRIQVEDGGPHPPVMGSVPGPNITAVDLVTDTIFASNHSGQVDSLQSPQVWVQTITTSPETAPDDWVTAEGLLATVTVDTTGFLDGTYELRLTDTLDGRTDFGGVPADITNGSIRVVPEPHGILLALGCFWALLTTWRQRA
jgi:hypothetical protein